ncbi:MAG: hypothetical protein FJW34_09445 [Acidobacteria bacterium]|nr:hypothetical protein [Acidobacteriota bacterium]
MTDDVDDKKCDLVFVDREMGLGLVAQAYEARNTSRLAAPSNKAADLNTAASWLLSRDLADLPEKLRPAATDLRQALQE